MYSFAASRRGTFSKTEPMTLGPSQLFAPSPVGRRETMSEYIGEFVVAALLVLLLIFVAVKLLRD
jgi:hypothetical protein